MTLPPFRTLYPPPVMDQVSVILVEPRSPGNVGMVARAMANFGAADLRLVNPCDHLAEEARRFAVDACGLLETAHLYPNLQTALADCHWSVAATRRQGKRRGTVIDVHAVPPLAQSMADRGRLALVFGREDAGLSSAEVALCTHTATIPAPGSLGSLNLAQATLIFLYELGRGPRETDCERDEAPTQAEVEPLLQQMETVLGRIAFLNPHRPEHVLTPLRRMLARSIADRHDLALLRAVWGRLEESINDWRGRRRGDEKLGKSG